MGVFPFPMPFSGPPKFGSFSPLALFAASEPGGWYDPSDLTTLFQDAAGTTPVTAVEQPVGLVLDKSKGLTLGTELVTNGAFSNGTTGWTVSGQSSISGGQARIVSSDGTFQNIAQSKTLSGPAWYELSVDIVSVTSGGISFAFTGAGINVALGSVAGTKKYRFYIPANTSSSLSFARTVGVTDLTIDNISVRELPGNHLSQSTSTARPVLKQDANGCYYLLFDGTDDFLVSGTINPGSVDKAQVFAGVRKLAAAGSIGIVAEMGNSVLTAGTLNVASPGSVSGSTENFSFTVNGSQFAGYDAATYTAPITAVLSCSYDIGGSALADEVKPRINGTIPSTLNAGTNANAGTGTFTNQVLNVGSRNAGSALRFNGHLYSLVLRFSATNMDAATIASTETWVNNRTKAY